MTTRRSKRAAERGAAVVEFALMLPLLLMLVLGAIDWGWYFYLREVVTNAAREGARAGAVSAVGGSAAATAAQTAATTYLNNLGLGGGTATATTPDVGGTHTVRVVVSYTAGSLTGFSLPGFQSLVPSTINATVQMRGEWP